jgi:hypothetical protein
VRIEYSAELLRQVHREGSGDRRGVLYGRRRDSQIRLLAARRTGHSRDLRLIGLERVGVFAVRSAGEVFLTENDLEFAEWNGADVALVLAAKQGGFFVREADGSMLAIRSHQEFAAPNLDPPKKIGFGRGWLNAVALAACLVLSVAAALYAEPKAALTLSVHEEAGQLIAMWSPGVRGTLEIQDGQRKLQVPITIQETRTTYQPESGDVNLLLTTLDGMTREEHVRIVDSPRRKASAIPPQVDQIAKLEAERERLVVQSQANRARLAQLERMVAR